MEAKLVDAVPEGQGWQFEPKWDGFRCLLFKDGRTVALQSKAGQPLGRYFPEIAQAAAALPVEKAVLDGEIVIPVTGGFSFESLLLRIHPSESRVRKLAAESPAAVLAFDLLVDGEGELVTSRRLSERRQRLEALASRAFAGPGPFRLSPRSLDRGQAEAWLEGARGVDGVMAKR